MKAYYLLGNWPVCWTVLELVLLAMTCSSFHIVSITVVRYIAIVHPLRYHAVVTNMSGLMGVAVTWIFALAMTLGSYWPIKPGKDLTYVQSIATIRNSEIHNTISLFSLNDVCINEISGLLSH